jgi:hypothetical protein
MEREAVKLAPSIFRADMGVCAAMQRLRKAINGGVE